MDNDTRALSTTNTRSRSKSIALSGRAQSMTNSANSHVSAPCHQSLTDDPPVVGGAQNESMASAARSLRNSTPDGCPPNSRSRTHKSNSSLPKRCHLPLGDAGLSRNGTLLTANGSPARAAAELKSILGGHNARLKSIRECSGPATSNRHGAAFEQAKPRARVEVDILLQTNIAVQGDYLRGHARIFIHEKTRKEKQISIAEEKIRVIGFESQGERRSIFYQCSAMLSSVTPSLEGLYASEHDDEGFAQAKEGEHDFPFALYLSLSAENGQAKGPYRQSDVSLSYIAMISLKIKNELGRCSIAHFYRACEIWPRLDPVRVLSSPLRPLQATVSATAPNYPKGGRIKLTAFLRRLYWVAGQYCQVKVAVDNTTNKTLKGLTLSLHRSTTIFPNRAGNQEAKTSGTNPHQNLVTTKQVAESILQMGQPGMKGHASAKGWWTGFRPGQVSEFEYSILIPIDALTISRGQLFEVEYSLCVIIDSGTRRTPDIQVIIPIRIVGFLSIDPPPSHPIKYRLQTPRSLRLAGSWQDTSEMGTSATPPPVCDADPNRPRRSEIENSSSYRRFGVDEPTIVNDVHEENEYGQVIPDSQHLNIERVELGNLSSADDTDEVVQQAITMAQGDLTYVGFSDLYFASLDRNLNETPDNSQVDGYDCPADTSEPVDEDSVSSVFGAPAEEATIQKDLTADSCVRPSSKFHKQSSFARRVEEKTRLITAAYLNGDHVAPARRRETQQAPQTAMVRQWKNRKPNLSLQIPPTLESQEGHRDLKGVGLESASSTSKLTRGSLESSHPPFLPQQTPFTPPSKEAEEINIPRPLCSRCATGYAEFPAAAVIAPPSTVLQYEVSQTKILLSGDMNSSPTRPRGLNFLQAPIDSNVLTPASAISTASHASTVSNGSVSVKDKVRELEERVKAAALV